MEERVKVNPEGLQAFLDDDEIIKPPAKAKPAKPVARPKPAPLPKTAAPAPVPHVTASGAVEGAWPGQLTVSGLNLHAVVKKPRKRR